MNSKSYRNWKVTYAPTARRYTAKGQDVEGRNKEVKADNRVDLERKVDEYLAPITFSVVEVNGVQTRISSRQHVVKSLMSPHADVVEDKDTPLCCSVASETYWSM